MLFWSFAHGDIVHGTGPYEQTPRVLIARTNLRDGKAKCAVDAGGAVLQEIHALLGMVGVDTEELLLFLLIFVEDAVSITSH